MVENDKYLLSPLGIYYEAIDKKAYINPNNANFWKFINHDYPEKAVDAYDVFPELVGREEEIQEIFSSSSGSLKVSGFTRGEHYLNLSILPGTIVIQDVTSEMLAKLEVVQSKNEAAILDEALKARNKELLHAYDKLDELMNKIRNHNHDLATEVKKRTAELLKSRMSVITMLARVAEFRDTDTGMHTFRIGQSSVMVGRLLGMGEKECEQLFYASLLHDIGKIGIPDSILLKPGRLDHDENKIMKTHTRIGAEILERQGHEIFDTARLVALYHHERWDGKGYPEGLAGEDIPLVGRICSIVDVFDALISRRPYKEAWPLDEAIAEIKRNSGRHFDPKVAQAFLHVVNDIAGMHGDEELEELLPPELE
ncbi:hypothetical protein MASR2M29_11260 [Spirochaetota bacterium]